MRGPSIAAPAETAVRQATVTPPPSDLREEANGSGATEGEPPKKKRKRGRKSKTEQREYDEIMHHFLIGYFTDQSCPSLRGFCREHGVEHLRKNMRVFIAANPRLQHIAVGERRNRSEHQREALAIVQRRYPAPAVVEEREEEFCEDEGVEPERVVTARTRTRTLF